MAHTRICLVDDDEVIRDSLQALFTSRGQRLSVFGEPARFLSIWLTSELREVPATFVLDIGMPEMSGIELFRQMREHGIPAHNQVLFLTGHGDVPLAVEAMKCGAFDFIEKPFSDNSLVDRVLESVRVVEQSFETSGRQIRCETSLSPRECEIAELITHGLTNKEIARRIGASVRTVEVHRLRLFKKLGVKNAAALAASFRCNGPNEIVPRSDAPPSRLSPVPARY